MTDFGATDFDAAGWRGAEAGAAPISELPVYFLALKNAAEAIPVGTALWSTVETFSQAPNLSNDRYPPATALRIQRQVNQVRPYVSGMVNWIYGNDLSVQATYYPVEASALEREYHSRSRPVQVAETLAHRVLTYSSTPSSSSSYPDDGGTELADGGGGGFNGFTLTDWAGYRVEDTGGMVTITTDLGASESVTIQAQSAADASKIATAVVTLNPGTADGNMVGPVNPSSGMGRSQLFRFDANARSGNLDWIQILIHSELSAVNACLVYYLREGNMIRLSVDDPSPALNGWTEEAVALGTAGKTLENSQCSIDVANSSAAGTSASVAVQLSVTFKPAFWGTKHIYMNAQDDAGYLSYWPYLGYWVVP